MAEQRQNREGGTGGREGRACVCVKKTDVTAKNNQYSLQRWWKPPCVGGQLLVQISARFQPFLFCFKVYTFGMCVFFQFVHNMLFKDDGSCIFSGKSNNVSTPEMLISLLTLCQNCCEGYAPGISLRQKPEVWGGRCGGGGEEEGPVCASCATCS